MKSRFPISVLLLLLLLSCSAQSAEQERMLPLASHLLPLSMAVETYVLLEHPPADMSEQELLAKATQDRPELLDPFKRYQLHVLRDARHTSVLVCSEDGQRALLEDADCTDKFDANHWQDSHRPCAFTVDLKEACGEE